MNVCHHIRMRDGRVRALAPGELMPEGATLFSSVVLKDHEPDHDPPLDRDKADRAYAKMKADISNAWQRPSPDANTTAPPASSATPDEARAGVIARLSEAYKVVQR